MRSKTTGQRSRDPKEELAVRRAEAACALDASLLAARAADPRLTHDVVAASLGGSPTLLSTMCHAEHERTIDVARASMLPTLARCELAQWIVGDEHVVVRLEVEAEVGPITLSLITRSHRSTAAAVGQLLEGVSDGHLDAAEGAALEATCDRALIDLLTIRELARRAQRERVIAVPSPARVQ